ncbi:unnamed protein product [Rhizophagus irregularis]|nr:unnamed protein product [Rhizophagus irregularis]
MSNLNQAKRYFCSYFIPCTDLHGIFWWDPDSKSLKYIPDKNIGKLIRLITKNFYIQSPQGISETSQRLGSILTNGLYMRIPMYVLQPVIPINSESSDS